MVLPDPVVPDGVDLWHVLRERRSRRGGPSRTVSIGNVSALLAYSHRVQRATEDNFGEISFRPVASGGARHPIDVCVVALRVEGLTAGVYQYDPLAHALHSTSIPLENATLLSRIALSALVHRPETLPAFTLLFAIVPGRTGCKYSNSALLTIAKDVGCLIQQLYLVVDGLKLFGTAIDGADTATVEAALGIAGTAHTFLGGFLVW